MKIHKMLTVTATLTALTMTMAACGGTTTKSDSGNPKDQYEMTVSLLPIMDVLPVQVALQEGIFEKHGLAVETVPAQSGSGLVPAVLEGSVDVAYGSTMTYLLGMEKELPIEVVHMAGAEERPEGEPGGEHSTLVLMVNDDSPIDSPADLEDKIVSVNGVGSIQEVAVKTAVEEAGGDPDSVQLLELPLSQAQGALEAGRIDAASVNVPFTTIMLNDGMRSIGETVKSIDGKNSNLELYFTSQQFAEENPEALEAFRAALDEAIDLVNDDLELSRETLENYTDIDPEIIEQLPILHFQKGVSLEEVTALVAAAKKQGVLADDDKVTPEKVMENTPTVEDE